MNDRPLTTDDGGRFRAALLAAIAVAVGMAAWSAAHMACISRDGTHYIEFAKQLAQDPRTYILAQKSQPGYSALILATHAAVGRWLSDDPVIAWIRAGQLVGAAGYVACVALLYLLTRRLFDARCAAVAAGLAALWPQAVQLGGDVLSDMPHLALYLAATLLAGWAISGRSWIALVLSGVAAAMAYLVRQEALALPLGTAAYLAWSWRGPRSVSRRGIAMVVLAASFVLPLTPYMAITGKILHKKTIYDLLFRKRDASVDAGHMSGLECMRIDSGGGPRHSHILKNVGVSVAGQSPPYIEFPLRLLDAWARSGRYVLSTLVLIALIARRGVVAQRDWRRLVLILIALQCVAVERRCATFGEFSNRYALIPAALSLPWAAAGLCVCVDWILSRSPRLSRHAAWTLAWLAAAAPMLAYALQPIRGPDAYLRIAGDWLRAHSTAGDEILSEGGLSRVTYYADRKWERWPKEVRWTIDDLLMFDGRAGQRPRWFVQLTEDERLGENDALLDAILHHPRWPGAKVEYPDGPSHRQIRIVRLRP